MAKRRTRSSYKRELEERPLFDHIPDEVLLRIVKNLSLVDRVRVEMVSRRFKRIANELWSKQQVLKVAGVDMTPLRWEYQIRRHCRLVEHRYGVEDTFILKREETSIESRLSLVKKCPSLIALYWHGCVYQDIEDEARGCRSVPRQIAKTINTFCPQLEHFVLYDCVRLDKVKPFLDCSKIKCLHSQSCLLDDNVLEDHVRGWNR